MREREVRVERRGGRRRTSVIAALVVASTACAACTSAPASDVGSPAVSDRTTPPASAPLGPTNRRSNQTTRPTTARPTTTTTPTTTVPGAELRATGDECVVRSAADASLDLDPSEAIVAATSEGAPIPGSRALLADEVGDGGRRRFFVRRLGDRDLVAISVMPEVEDAEPTVVIGRHDPATPDFTAAVVIENCFLSDATATGSTVWFTSAGSGRPANYVVMEVDVAAATARWSWRSTQLLSLRVEAGSVRAIAGWTPTGAFVATIAAGSGEVLSEIDLDLDLGRGENVIESDGPLWTSTFDNATSTGTYRRYDAGTGAVVGTVVAPGRVDARGNTQGALWAAVRGPYLWRAIGGGLERWSIADGTMQWFDLGGSFAVQPRASSGPSGIWILSPGGVDGLTATLVHVDGDEPVSLSTFPIGAERDHRGPTVPLISAFSVDARGFVYRDLYDGHYAFGPATTWTFDLGPSALAAG